MHVDRRSDPASHCAERPARHRADAFGPIGDPGPVNQVGRPANPARRSDLMGVLIAPCSTGGPGLQRRIGLTVGRTVGCRAEPDEWFEHC